MIVPDEDFSAAVTGTVEPKNHFLHFLKSTVSEKCQKKKLRGNGERNPHQVARERIFPFWGKCGLQANLALIIPNYSG
jgi:hypothetical protein